MTQYDDINMAADLREETRQKWLISRKATMDNLTEAQRNYLCGYLLGGLSWTEEGREDFDVALEGAQMFAY